MVPASVAMTIARPGRDSSLQCRCVDCRRASPPRQRTDDGSERSTVASSVGHTDAMEPEEFVVVTVGASEQDANERFDAWLHARGMTRASLGDADVRTDIVTKFMGIRFWRYWVRGTLVTGPPPTP